MSEKIQIVCGTCGSADVRRDAWAEWDTDKQDWVGGAVFDAGHCEVCEGETSLEEVPLDEWRVRELVEEEVEGLIIGVVETKGFFKPYVRDDRDPANIQLWSLRQDDNESAWEAKDRARKRALRETR